MYHRICGTRGVDLDRVGQIVHPRSALDWAMDMAGWVVLGASEAAEGALVVIGPGRVGVMDTVQVEHRALRALGAWSAASATAGAASWLAGRWARQPVVAAFGVQTLLWGASNAALVACGGVTSGAVVSARQARSVRWASMVTNLAVAASGVVLIARPRSAPRWLRWPDRTGDHVRGHGLAVLAQGVVLLIIDAWASRHLRALAAPAGHEAPKSSDRRAP